MFQRCLGLRCPDDGDIKHLRNVGKYLSNLMAQHHRRHLNLQKINLFSTLLLHHQLYYFLNDIMHLFFLFVMYYSLNKLHNKSNEFVCIHWVWSSSKITVHISRCCADGSTSTNMALFILSMALNILTQRGCTDCSSKQTSRKRFSQDYQQHIPTFPP